MWGQLLVWTISALTVNKQVTLTLQLCFNAIFVEVSSETWSKDFNKLKNCDNDTDAQVHVSSDRSGWGFWGLWCTERWSESSLKPCWHHWWFGEQSQHSGAPPGDHVSYRIRASLKVMSCSLVPHTLKAVSVIPALNHFHAVHQFHVLISGLDFGHDYCSGWCVKLEEKRLDWTQPNDLLSRWSNKNQIFMITPVVVQPGQSSAGCLPRCTPHRSLPHTAWWTWSRQGEQAG